VNAGGTARARGSAAACALLVALLTSGCHHKTTVSRSYPPRPMSSPRSDTTVVRRTPAYATPDPGVDDNAVASGRVNSTEVGLASWYGPPYHNHQAANGEIFDQNAMTAAHRTLPLGTVVSVTNLATGQAVTVRINDRGPFVHGRVLDLSLAAAKAAGVYRMGVARVRIDVLEQRAGADLTGGKWCVQVGAFLSKDDSLRLQNDLLRRYASTAKVIQFQGPTGYWVRINPLTADRARAAQIAQSIQPAEPGAIPYLVRLD
jgi:rare lipoprotein A